MTEEQLKQIEKAWEWGKKNLGNGSLNLNEKQIEKLITEVKRLREIEEIIPTLELENKFVRARNERLQRELDELTKEYERLKEIRGNSA